MKVLVTGSAGFIGFHLCQKLLARGDEVIGIDNYNAYYDVNLKSARAKQLKQQTHFTEYKIDIANREAMEQCFDTVKPSHVVHLAAQAGVRYSLDNPHSYTESNLVGFTHILEGCRQHHINHLVYASSSSVYGANTKVPFSVHDNVDHPLSLYAATKKANELMAHTYSHLYQIPTTGLRFFTVYGPWGRPDMALFKFTDAILNGKAIDVYNYGQHKRDFTYIDDIIEGVVRSLDQPATAKATFSPLNPDPASSMAPYRLYNIGSNNPVELLDYINVLESALGKKAKMNLLPLQPGDVVDTFADVNALVQDVHYQPTTSIETGIVHFVQWYRNFYRV